MSNAIRPTEEMVSYLKNTIAPTFAELAKYSYEGRWDIIGRFLQIIDIELKNPSRAPVPIVEIVDQTRAMMGLK